MSSRPRLRMSWPLLGTLVLVAACSSPAIGTAPTDGTDAARRTPVAETPATTPVAETPAPTPAYEVVLRVPPGDGLAFEPETISAPPATLVRITLRNDSSQAHNLTFQAPIEAATRTIVEAGRSDSATFVTPVPGTYTFVCTIHMGMSGTLTVE